MKRTAYSLSFLLSYFTIHKCCQLFYSFTSLPGDMASHVGPWWWQLSHKVGKTPQTQGLLAYRNWETVAAELSRSGCRNSSTYGWLKTRIWSLHHQGLSCSLQASVGPGGKRNEQLFCTWVSLFFERAGVKGYRMVFFQTAPYLSLTPVN